MEYKDSFHVDLDEYPEHLINQAKKYHQQMVTEGKSLQEVMNVSDSFLEEIYGVAFSYYNQGKYKEALSLFYYLISICPKNARFVFGFASCLYQLQDYQGASVGFYMASALNENDPLAAFYAADSLLKNNQENEANAFLDRTIAAAGKDNKHSTLIERCKLIKAALKNKN